MSATSNLQTVQGLYEAFGRGDVAAVLSHLTDDVDWSVDGPPDGPPWYPPGRGRAAVETFFTVFGGAVELDEFTPIGLAANDTEVFAFLQIHGKVRANGKEIAMHLHHYFRFRGDEVEYYRGSEDTAQMAAAMAA